MPVQIGERVHSFSDPTAILSDCHRRIEMFLGLLEAAGKVIAQPITDETGRMLTSAIRYFREAAPKHTADEEESLFPRLRQAHNPDLQSALGHLEELEQEHRWAAPLHDRIERLGGLCLSKGNLSRREAETFRRAVASLISMYQKHISVEDQLVFPLAAAVLSETDRASIAGEMAARRNVQLVTALPNFRKKK